DVDVGARLLEVEVSVEGERTQHGEAAAHVQNHRVGVDGGGAGIARIVLGNGGGVDLEGDRGAVGDVDGGQPGAGLEGDNQRTDGAALVRAGGQRVIL